MYACAQCLGVHAACPTFLASYEPGVPLHHPPCECAWLQLDCGEEAGCTRCCHECVEAGQAACIPGCRWIVWKLASYERVFGAVCAGRALTREAVMQQLQHRCAHAPLHSAPVCTCMRVYACGLNGQGRDGESIANVGLCFVCVCVWCWRGEGVSVLPPSSSCQAACASASVRVTRIHAPRITSSAPGKLPSWVRTAAASQRRSVGRACKGCWCPQCHPCTCIMHAAASH